MTPAVARLGLLAAVNVLLVLGVLRLLAMPVDVSPTPPRIGRGALPAADGSLAALDLTSLEHNQALSRPLFAPDRRPWQEPMAPETFETFEEPEMTYEPEAAPPELSLVGIGIANGRASALLLDPMQGEPEWVAEGDSIARWTVRAVSDRSVTLEGDGGTVSLSLYPSDPGQ